MLAINKKQIDAVRKSEVLRDFVREQLSDQSLSLKDQALLSDDEWAELENVCLEVLRNDAPIVKEIDAEQSKGVYTISIHGIPGAYWVFAPEFDIEGVFSTLSEALAEVDSQHGEFLVDPDSPTETCIDDDLSDSSYDSYEPNFGDGLLRLMSCSDDLGEIDRIRERILHDKHLIRLANGSVADSGPPPKGLGKLLEKLDRSLGKVTGYIAGMGRHSRMMKAEAFARLFHALNGRLPAEIVMRKLYDI
jgi:hypothetical protein